MNEKIVGIFFSAHFNGLSCPHGGMYTSYFVDKNKWMIKTTRYYYIPKRMAKTQNNDNMECW